MNTTTTTLIGVAALLLLSITARVFRKTKAGGDLTSMAEMFVFWGLIMLDWRMAIATSLLTNVGDGAIAVVYDLLGKVQIKTIIRESQLVTFALLVLFLPQALVWPYIVLMAAVEVVLMAWLFSKSFRARLIVACAALAGLITMSSTMHLQLLVTP